MKKKLLILLVIVAITVVVIYWVSKTQSGKGSNVFDYTMKVGSEENVV